MEEMTATIYELWIAMISLALAIGCRAIIELWNHDKLKWSNEGKFMRGFWDDDSYLRKYKLTKESTVIAAPNNWYYRFFKLKYKERWPTSATFTVFLTDAPHFLQWIYHILLSLTVVLLTGFPYLIVWLGVVTIHASAYRLFQK